VSSWATTRPASIVCPRPTSSDGGGSIGFAAGGSVSPESGEAGPDEVRHGAESVVRTGP
jgi:hypothetical protein